MRYRPSVWKYLLLSFQLKTNEIIMSYCSRASGWRDGEEIGVRKKNSFLFFCLWYRDMEIFSADFQLNCLPSALMIDDHGGLHLCSSRASPRTQFELPNPGPECSSLFLLWFRYRVGSSSLSLIFCFIPIIYSYIIKEPQLLQNSAHQRRRQPGKKIIDDDKNATRGECFHDRQHVDDEKPSDRSERRFTYAKKMTMPRPTYGRVNR